jgi:hypothetical protein
MALFGRKKEEVKKEYEDIQQIKEAIEPSDIPSVSRAEQSSVTEQWLREVGSSPSQPEEAGEWATQQFSAPGQIPKAELLQTQNVSRPRSLSTVLQKNQMEIPESVPLFIKLDRYKNILHTISDLKSTVTKVKNAFEMFSEMERVKAQNLRVLEAAVQKVEARLADLDSEFLRPAGLKEKEVEQPQEFSVAEEIQNGSNGNDEGLHGMISDLRVQITKLKEELDQMSEPEQQ